MKQSDNRKASLRLTGQIKEGRDVVGYIVLQIASSQSQIMTSDVVIKLAIAGEIVNATVNEKREIVGTQGSLTRLPIFNSTGTLMENPRVTVLGVTQGSNKDRQYMLMDPYGRSSLVNTDNAIKLIKQYECTNAKLVNKDGKLIISSIAGVFNSIQSSDFSQADKHKYNKEKANQNNQILKENKEYKEKKWVRSIDDARYLGKVTPSDSADLYRRVLTIREVRRSISKESTIRYSLIRETCVGKVGLVSKILNSFIAGKVGSRTKKHYPYTYKLLKGSSSPVKEAMELKRIKDMLSSSAIKRLYKVNYDDFNIKLSNNKTPYKDIDKYMKFLEALYIDCLNYARATLSKDHLKDLIKQVTSHKAASEYIVKASGNSNVEQVLKTAIRESMKSRIDSTSTVMFVCGLELISLHKLPISRSVNMDVKQRYTSSIISDVAFLTQVEPVKIETEKDYGSMIFQALIIVIAS